MFFNFDEETRKIIISSKREMKNLKHSYIGSEHLLLSILKYGNSVKDILKKNNLTYELLKKEIINVLGKGDNDGDIYLYTPLYKNIIENSIVISRENKIDVINTKVLLLSMFEEQDGMALRLLTKMSIDINKIYKALQNDNKNNVKNNNKKLLIEEFGYDMSKVNLDEFDPVYGREQEINRIIEILSRRRKNNPLLIGDAGVGKTAIVEELSKRIKMSMVPDKIRNMRIISISMASLISGTKYRGEFEDRINKILKEIEEENNVILFIDEIHTLMGAGGAEGAIDASNILKPYLARGKIKVIGATTTFEYKKYLENDKALDRRFQIVDIEEPDNKDVYNVLKKLKPIYEMYHNVIIDDSLLNEIVLLSNKYIKSRKQPDKAIDILDEVCAKVSISLNNFQINKIKKLEFINQIKEEKKMALINKDFQKANSLKKELDVKENEFNKYIYNNKKNNVQKKVTLKDVAEIIKCKTKIPMYEILPEDSKKIRNLAKNIKKHVFGQDNIINEICNVLVNNKLGLNCYNKSISFLFVGAGKTGKTYLSNVLASELSGKDKNIIKLDMNEFYEEHSLSKILGSPPGYVGYDNKNNVLEEVKMKPHSVILFENIDKASKSVLNLLYEILDEGIIKNSYGEIVDFRNNILIFTVSIDNETNSLGFLDKKSDKVDFSKKINIELTKRVSKVLYFNNFNDLNIKDMILKKFKLLKEKYDVNDALLTNSDLKKLLCESNYNLYGADKIDEIVNNIFFNKYYDETKKINVKI